MNVDGLNIKCYDHPCCRRPPDDFHGTRSDDLSTCLLLHFRCKSGQQIRKSSGAVNATGSLTGFPEEIPSLERIFLTRDVAGHL